MIQLYFCAKRRIPKRTREAMCRLAKLAPSVTPINHRLRVFVAPAISVECEDTGGLGFGAFCVSPSDPKSAQIWMGSIPPYKRLKVENWLRDIFAHELAHYEQYRDGRKIQERGVAVRTRTLAKAFERLRAARAAGESTEVKP